MKILHVIQRYWPCVGGSEKFFQEISERFAREGHEVCVVTTNAGDPEYFWLSSKEKVACLEDVHNGVRIRRFPVQHLPLSEVLYLRVRHLITLVSKLPVDTSWLLAQVSRTTPYVPALRRELESTRERYDIVHAGNVLFEPLVTASLKYARTRGIPFVLTPWVHLGEEKDDSVRKNYTNRYQMRLIAASDKIICQTDIERDYLARQGISAEKMVSVGSGINPEEVSGGNASRFRARYNIGGPVIFFVGAQSFDKGVCHLLEAMKLLWESGQKAALVLAGPITEHFSRYYDSQPDEVRRKCLQLGVVSDETKRDLMAAGDVFVMPSRVDSFGIVYLEAWLYRKPVIGAIAGGVPEVIEHGRDGLLVPFGDVQKLAGSIQTLLDNPELARELGERGYQKVTSVHTWEKKFSRIRNLYLEIC